MPLAWICSFDQCLTCGLRDFPLFLSAVHLPEFRSLQPSCKISWGCKKRITVLGSPLIFKAAHTIAVLEVVYFIITEHSVFSFILFTWLLSFHQVLVILAFALCPVTLHSVVSVTYYLTPKLAISPLSLILLLLQMPFSCEAAPSTEQITSPTLCL